MREYGFAPGGNERERGCASVTDASIMNFKSISGAFTIYYRAGRAKTSRIFPRDFSGIGVVTATSSRCWLCRFVVPNRCNCGFTARGVDHARLQTVHAGTLHLKILAFVAG